MTYYDPPPLAAYGTYIITTPYFPQLGRYDSTMHLLVMLRTGVLIVKLTGMRLERKLYVPIKKYYR